MLFKIWTGNVYMFHTHRKTKFQSFPERVFITAHLRIVVEVLWITKCDVCLSILIVCCCFEEECTYCKQYRPYCRFHRKYLLHPKGCCCCCWICCRNSCYCSSILQILKPYFKHISQTSIFLVVIVDNKTHFHYERYGTTTVIHISDGFVYNLWGYIFFFLA